MKIYTATLLKNNGLIITQNIGAINKRKAIYALTYDNGYEVINIKKIGAIK